MTGPSDARQRTLDLQARALRFSVAVNRLCPKTFSDLPSTVVWGQLVRAADSVSNNLLEADDASSTADFVYRMKLTLRETKEPKQCLAKLRMSCLDGSSSSEPLEREAAELSAIFAAIVLNVSRRQERERRRRPPP